MKTALEILGPDKFEFYRELHFMDFFMIAQRCRYSDKDDLYKDMKYNFAYYYAETLYKDPSLTPRWVKAYEYITALPFEDVIIVAETLHRKERRYNGKDLYP